MSTTMLVCRVIAVRQQLRCGRVGEAVNLATNMGLPAEVFSPAEVDELVAAGWVPREEQARAAPKVSKRSARTSRSARSVAHADLPLSDGWSGDAPTLF